MTLVTDIALPLRPCVQSFRCLTFHAANCHTNPELRTQNIAPEGFRYSVVVISTSTAETSDISEFRCFEVRESNKVKLIINEL